MADLNSDGQTRDAPSKTGVGIDETPLRSLSSLSRSCSPAAARRAERDGGIGDRGIYQTTLPNGLQVVVVEDHAAPVVHTDVFGTASVRSTKRRERPASRTRSNT